MRSRPETFLHWPTKEGGFDGKLKRKVSMSKKTGDTHWSTPIRKIAMPQRVSISCCRLPICSLNWWTKAVSWKTHSQPGSVLLKIFLSGCCKHGEMPAWAKLTSTRCSLRNFKSDLIRPEPHFLQCVPPSPFLRCLSGPLQYFIQWAVASLFFPEIISQGSSIKPPWKTFSPVATLHRCR